MSTQRKRQRGALGVAERRGVTRRAVLRTGAAAGALGVLAPRGRSASDVDPALRAFLLDRITWGIDEAVVNDYEALGGYTPYLEWQLDADNVPDPNLVADLRQDNPDFADTWWDPASPASNPVEYPNKIWALTMPPLFARMHPGAWALMYYTTVQEQALLGYRSTRQLYWSMAEFWQNVHNTFCLPILQRPIWNDLFRDKIARNCLGYYGDLVKASGQSASMLYYLNQASSTLTAPIENYAREVLELHTVGVEDGTHYHPDYGAYPTFTEADIVPVAEIFTGWTVDLTPGQQTYGQFYFDASKHKPGAKTVPFLNKTYADTGQGQGEELIADLAGRPPGGPLPAVRPHVLTSFHMAVRLMEWFLCDDALVPPFRDHTYRVAAAFWASYGDIKAAVRALFDEVYVGPLTSAGNVKVRNPLKLVTAVMRALQPTLSYPNLEWALRLQKMGRLTGNHPAPDGYSNHSDAWSASMMARFEYVYDAVYDHNNMGWTTSAARLDQIFPPGSVPSTAYLQRLDALFGGGQVPAAELVAAQSYIDSLNQPTGPYDLRKEALVVFFSLPSLQALL